MLRYAVTLSALVLVALSAPAATWYVDGSAAGAGTGDSWTDAFTDIQSAVNAAAGDGGGDVWVAAGTYTSTSDPVVTMASGVNIYGGFASGASEFSERDWTTNLLAIDGENARRCVIGADNAVLDGFYVIQGNILGHGGGMYNNGVSPTVANCFFAQNNVTGTGLAGGRGAGMYNQNCTATITNCAFTHNTSTSGGVGMYNYLADVTVTDCYFGMNVTAQYYTGGGMYNSESSPTVTNCFFEQNGGYTGSAIGFYNSSAVVNNCTIVNNTAEVGNGGAVHANGSSAAPTLTNCIVWGNTGGGIYNTGVAAVVNYSLIQGGYSGTSNLNEDPLFVSSTDYHLQETSPCVDTGDDSVVTASTDYDGNARISGEAVDMGVYEIQAPEVPVAGGIALVAVAAALALSGARFARRSGE